MDELTITILGGLITAIIIQAIWYVLKNMIYPWFIGISSNIRINGDYKTIFKENGNARTEEAKLEYVGRTKSKIKGVIKTNSTTYNFRGSFRNLIITAEYWNKNNAKLDRGTFTLMVLGNGDILEGKYSWFEGKGNVPTPIKGGDYKWEKKHG